MEWQSEQEKKEFKSISYHSSKNLSSYVPTAPSSTAKGQETDQSKPQDSVPIT